MTCLHLPANLLALDKDESTLLELVRGGHRAAAQSIHTFSCRFSGESISASEGQFDTKGNYRRSADGIRISLQMKGPHGSEHTDEILVRNGRVSGVYKQRNRSGKVWISGNITAGSSHLGDVWWMALLKFWGAYDLPVPFDELLNQPCSVSQVKRVTREGKALLYVDLTHGTTRTELWFDPNVNYLVRKEVIHGTVDGKRNRNEKEVVRFKEVSPAIFFPEEVSARRYVDGQLDGNYTRTFSDIRINQPLPSDTFQLRYPPGIELLDFVQDKAFKVEADGRLTELKDRRLNHGPVRASQLFKGRTLSHAATQEEPKSFTRWILPASLLLLVVAAGIWVLRRRWLRSERAAG